jgi:lipopolysaccharide export system ATP-binding protein
MMSQSLRVGLCTQGVVKYYGKREVVRGVDVNVAPGEVVGLLGPNGAGKTTTFYMIVGLLSATKGEILLEGESITHLPMHKRARLGVGYLPQEASVFRKLTVRDNIKAIAETLRLTKADENSCINEHLNELHLAHLADQKAYTLSGGERRRLEISRALVTNPRYLLMDEPFSGIDPISVQEVQQIVLNLKHKGIGVLITDHNVRETLKIVDRAYLMYDGRVLCEGTREQLIEDPQAKKLYLGESFHF